MTSDIRIDPIGVGSFKYWFKIDKNGNIDIKTQRTSGGLGSTTGEFITQLIINDNIPIPNYLIEPIKELLNPPDNNLYSSYFYNLINVFKQLKNCLYLWTFKTPILFL